MQSGLQVPIAVRNTRCEGMTVQYLLTISPCLEAPLRRTGMAVVKGEGFLMKKTVLAFAIALVSTTAFGAVPVLLSPPPPIRGASESTPSPPPCSDPYEPDDIALATSAAIRNGDVQHRDFCDDPVDWVNFSACAGRTYEIKTSDLGEEAYTLIELYAPDAITLLASDDDGGGGFASRLLWTAERRDVSREGPTSHNSYGQGKTYSLQLRGGLDPISWTLSERWIRCPGWEQERQGDGRDGGSLTSSRRGRCGWSGRGEDGRRGGAGAGSDRRRRSGRGCDRRRRIGRRARRA